MQKHLVVVALYFMIFLPEPASAQLQAGTAKADITPPIGGLMYGYGARGTNVSTGVHDPLFAKALVLENGGVKVAIVTLDLGSFPVENTNRVREIIKQEAGIESLACIASHSHSTPRFSEEFPTKEAPWVREMERKVATAVVEASKNLQPARLGVAWGEVREGHNRRMIKTNGEVFMLWANRERYPTSPVDYSLGVLQVQHADAKPMATLVNYACHPVVLGPENLEFSADYVGAFSRVVEESGGGQCMFLSGAFGDINPFWDKTPPAEGAFDQVEAMGKAVADEVLRVTGSMNRFVAEPTLSFTTDTITLKHRDPANQEPIPAEISTLLIGKDLALGLFPGEFFVEHGLRFKEESLFRDTFFVGYANDALHYFPTIKSVTQGGYGAASATHVEIGAGERLVNQALVNLYLQANKIAPQ